jgi:hypothetical protein
MPVYYGGKAVIPAPLATITKEYQATEDGRLIGSDYSIVLRGKLTYDKGSPRSDGTLWDQSGYPADETIAPDQRLKSILRKQDALRRLFATPGQTLEIVPLDGSLPTKCNPVLRRIDFAEGNWVTTCDYTVTLEAPRLYVSGVCLEDQEFSGYYLSRLSEEWSLEVVDETKFTYRLTHSVSATGKLVYEPDGSLPKLPWEYARDAVLNSVTLGITAGRVDRVQGTVLPNTANLNAYNFLRTQHQNEDAGQFSVTETWLCWDPGLGYPAVEDFNCSIRQAVNDGRVTVSLEGVLTGLQVSDNVTGQVQSLRYDNALLKWNTAVFPTLLTRAQTYSGIPLNPVPVQHSVALNPVAGTLSYHWEYDNRPLPAVAGALSEVVSISERYPSDIFAAIPVPGRSVGPILQDVQTRSERRRTISISIAMSPATLSFTPSIPNTAAIVLANRPTGVPVFVESDEAQWNASHGTYSRNTTFVWVQ